MVFSTAYPRTHFTIYLEFYLGRGGIFDCVSTYPRIHFTIYLEVYLGRGGIFDCVSAYSLHNIVRSLLGEEWYFGLRIRVSTLQYTKNFTWGGVVFSTAYPRIRVSAYPRIHFTTYYLEVYLGRGGTFDCVSTYPAFSEVQLQNGTVFCSYSKLK